MAKLGLAQLKDFLGWAFQQKDKKGKSLVERARECLMSGSYYKYDTKVEITNEELENSFKVIYWDCNCPASTKGKHRKRPCKHVVAQIILMHEKELSQNPKWAEWFREFNRKQMEEALKAFEAFEDLKEFEDF